MSNSHPTPTTMESAVAGIVGRDLSPEERQMLIRLRDQYGYDDSDPLVVVLAMTGAVTLITADIPNRIKSASDALIETHATILRQQSMLIAKELVGTIAEQIYTAGRGRRRRYIEIAVSAFAGALLIGLIWFFKHFS